MERLFLKVQGIVQGVGLRPFVYNQAISLGLKGWINNNSEGVHIDIEGEKENIEYFINNLKYYHPLQAKIESITAEIRELINYSTFEIKESKEYENNLTLVSPDLATCEKCASDIKNSENRRYKYSFTNCTNCGPRFSIIKSLPYDRVKTTMKKFEMCPHCRKEYENPADRRFHAQPNACAECGPDLWIEDSMGKRIDDINPVEFAKQCLKEGKIFAVKGLGGFHLVCDAQNKEAVKELRTRKRRPHKPFAVMFGNIDTAKKYCHINMKEEEVLTGSKKPVVILNRINEEYMPELIAPQQKTLGVMLPYTPLHYLIMEDGLEALIMTSANINGLPLEYDNNKASEKLGYVADYFLMHDRDIHIPIDDSVVKIIDNEIHIIRRARGYVPEAFKQENIKAILACGSNMKNTFSIGKKGNIFLSQHNGDLDNEENIELYRNNIEHFKDIFSFEPEYIACDLHPGYISREYAHGSKLLLIEVQHHHAHIASCLGENNVNSKVIGIAFDGTGYGADGKIWGGEFFISDKKEFKRMAHLEYVKMPGGEKAVKEPWRMGLSYMYKYIESKERLKEMSSGFYGNKSEIIIQMIESNINSPETSSMGRFFDAAASLSGIRDNVTYEGQAAIEFEASAEELCQDSYSYEIIKEETYIIKTGKIIEGIIKDRLSGEKPGIISDKFHNTVVKFTVDICKLLRSETGIHEAALSGGVFHNSILHNQLREKLKEENFTVYVNKLIPSNDGGISFGQMIVANENTY